MTSRERVIAAIERKPLDRIPRYDGFWEDAIERWLGEGLHLPEPKTIQVNGETKMIDNPVYEYFNFDILPLYMDISMRFPTGLVADDGVKITVADRCGYTAQKFKGRASSMHFISHMVEDEDDWEKYKERLTLDPNDTARVDCESYYLHTKEYPTWEGFQEIFQAYRKTEKFIPVNVYGPWEAAWRHHGYENSLMDLVAEPEMMADMFDRFTDLTIATVQKMIDLGCKPDAVWLVEDMGGTHTTLFSPKTYRELLLPNHKKVGDFLHANGIYFFMHSCGYIEPFIPGLIEAGLDVLQAIQANTGMHVKDLKPKFGDQLTFFGNIAVQSYKNGPEAIEAELREKLPIAMEGGGYIYHSDHSIPPECSLETYLRTMQVLDEIGTY